MNRLQGSPARAVEFSKYRAGKCCSGNGEKGKDPFLLKKLAQTPQFECGTKQLCKEMTSSEEAKFYLKTVAFPLLLILNSYKHGKQSLFTILFSITVSIQ